VHEQVHQFEARVDACRQLDVAPDVLAAAGFEPGEHVVVRTSGAGRLVVERKVSVIHELAGMLDGVFGERYVAKQRGR
jgi:hypothetical protein